MSKDIFSILKQSVKNSVLHSQCKLAMQSTGWKGFFSFMMQNDIVTSDINIIFPHNEIDRSHVHMYPQFYIKGCTLGDILIQTAYAYGLSPRLYSKEIFHDVVPIRFIPICEKIAGKGSPVDLDTIKNAMSLLKADIKADTNRGRYLDIDIDGEKGISIRKEIEKKGIKKISIDMDYALKSQYFFGVLKKDENICEVMDKICMKLPCQWDWVGPDEIYLTKKE